MKIFKCLLVYTAGVWWGTIGSELINNGYGILSWQYALGALVSGIFAWVVSYNISTQ